MVNEEFFGTPIASRRIGKYRLSLREYPRNAELPQHTHGDAFVTVIVDGGFREKSSRSSLDCSKHDIVIHAAQERHVDQFVGQSTRCLSVQGGSFERNALLASSFASSIAVKLFREFRRADALSPMAIEAMMLELLVVSERQSSEQRMPRWLPRVRATLEERFQEPPTLTELAGSVDVHPAHVARAFRQHYDMTVGDLVRDLRIRYAMERLQSSASLAEIAHDAGFADQSHFTRLFRRAIGMTPARYRRTLTAF